MLVVAVAAPRRGELQAASEMVYMNSQPRSLWQLEILPNSFLIKWVRGFLRWFFSWRGLRRILIVLAWTATIIALVYGEENWRGRRAWNQYRQQLEARGEQLDLRAFIPKPVPDDQNFAATPFIKSWFVKEDLGAYDKLWNDNYWLACSEISSSRTATANRRFTDLVAWEKAFDAVRSGQTNSHHQFRSDQLDLPSRSNAAPAVLEGMKSSEARLAELRAASSRPHSRYPVIYDLDNPWAILLPHLAGAKVACQRLELKACAELAAHRSEQALEDVELMLHLADSLKGEPFVISYLVRLECAQIAVQPIWEGLAEHGWSDAQLQEVQRRLQQHDFLTDLKWPLAAERAAGILTCDLLASGKYNLCMLGSLVPASGEQLFPELMARLVPRGWYHQEQLSYCRLYQLELGRTFEGSNQRVSPSQVEAEAHELEREFAGSAGAGKALNALVIHHRAVASLLLPALANIARRSAEAQTVVNQAALACALERHRLASGQFPETLQGLLPRFVSQMPNDVLTGQSYKYHRTDAGQFVLYSVGWNEKDDGGVPGKTLLDEKQGDWVWQYPSQH